MFCLWEIFSPHPTLTDQESECLYQNLSLLGIRGDSGQQLLGGQTMQFTNACHALAGRQPTYMYHCHI